MYDPAPTLFIYSLGMISFQCMIIPWYSLISLSIVTLASPYLVETCF